MPCSVPNTSTPRNATSAQRNSIVRTLRMAASSAGWIRPSEYTITTAARVAWGSSPSSGASSSMVSAAIAAVTSDAVWERPPACRTTAVCEVPPPAGMAPNSAPPRLAAPVAISSRLASITGSSRPAKARPAAIVSVKLISAMPSAPGRSCSTSARSGSVSEGRPCGITPTVETPRPSRPSSHAAAMPPPTATSGAGECGHRRSMPNSTSRVAPATATVRSEASGTCCTSASASRKKPCFSMCTPSSLGSWSSTITSPMPALNPASTGVEMKLATKPRRRTAATTRITPTSAAKVASASSARAGSPSGTTSASWAPVRIAMVVVVLTLSTRERPRSA